MMLWAACCPAYFGLSWGDVVVDDPTRPSRMEMCIKSSITDPLRQDVSIFIGKVASDLCPVSAILAYMVGRGKKGGPLFRFGDGK